MTVSLTWAKPGHENEYIVNVPGDSPLRGEDGYILEMYATKLKDHLDGFTVLNRGSRIEILPPSTHWVDREKGVLREDTHPSTRSAVEAVFGPVDFTVLTVAPLTYPCSKCPSVSDSRSDAQAHLLDHIRSARKA